MNQVVFRLFNPSPSRSGAQKLIYVSTSTTTAATATMTVDAGSIVVKTVAEGVGANGVIVGNNLESGFALKIVAGVLDNTKFKIQLFKGVYQGADSDGDLFGGSPQGVAPTLLAESSEVSTLAELSAWVATNPTMNGYAASVVVTGDGALIAADLTNNVGFLAFTGATESYTSQNATDLVKELGEVDFNFVMVAESGASNAQSAINTQLFTMLKETSLDVKFLVVAAGEDSTDFDQLNTSSFVASAYYDHKQVFVWHGAIESTRPQGGFKKFSSLHGAALYTGLIAGLEPQEPATFKALNIDRPFYELSRRQRELAIKAGVVHTRNVRNRGWSVNQDVNTIQNNDLQVLPDGSSPEGSIMRIIAALNTLIRQAVELEFTGRSLADADPATVANFIEGLLVENTTGGGASGLIIRALDVSVTYDNGDLYAQYKFVPNGPVLRTFITGILLNITV